MVCLAVTARAEDAPPDLVAKMQGMRTLADGLQYRDGMITLPGKVATIEVGDDFRFLDQKDTETVLTKIWRNPPSPETLGMLLPHGMTPLDHGTWAVVISFDKSGYVKDSDASKLDYSKLLKDMQESAKAASGERQKQGYPPIELVNWATPPHFDSASHKLYWAKELRFGDSSGETLNYCIRALGRHGVLELNAVAPMEQLPGIEQATPAILKMVSFDSGERYTDFNVSTDKVAGFGLAALIAGGVLAKTGLLKGLLVGILALKKFVIVGAVAAYAGIKKFFARFTGKREQNPQV